MIDQRSQRLTNLLEEPDLLGLDDFFSDGEVGVQAVFAAEAGGAIAVGGAVHAAEHALEGEVVEGINAEEGADVVEGAAGGDELAALGEVNAEVAGVADGGAGDAEVDF